MFGNLVEQAVGAAIHGAKVGAAKAANDAAFKAFVNALGKKCPDFLKTPEGEAVAKAILPIVALVAADTLPEGVTKHLPISVESIKMGCKLVIEGTSREAIEHITPFLIPVLTEFAKLGAGAVMNVLEDHMKEQARIEGAAPAEAPAGEAAPAGEPAAKPE